MAEPAIKFPPEPSNEALDILRRLEPALTRLTTDVAELKAEQKEQRKDIMKLKEDVARIDGRVSQLPTTVQLFGFVLAVLVVSGIMKYLMQ